MTLREARKKIEKLENEIERLLSEKEILFQKTQPQSVDTTKQNVSGGNTRSEKFLKYVITQEERKLNEDLDLAYAQKSNLENWLETELKILKKYNELEQQVIYYKDDYIPRAKYESTWWWIAKQVHASESTCRRIYSKYKKKRDV